MTAQPRLTAGQFCLLQLLATGHTQKEIAARLHLSARSAARRCTALYRALGAHNAPHAVHLAHQHGHLTAPPTTRKDTTAA